MTQTPDQWAKIRAQFDSLPYPNVPLEQVPGDHPTYLSAHSCTIPYYLRYHQVVDTQGKTILDAGCGSGFKAMALAIANPGAHIVGVDISSKSVELAHKRIEYHGIPNPVNFHCASVEDLSDLPYQFDYINCDETLYLLPDPAAGLRAMQAVLKPEGIIRTNLHSAYQRADWYRMQALFKEFGCLEGELADDEMALVRQTMNSVEDWVVSKRALWNQNKDLMTDAEKMMANILLRGDKGYNMREFSALLRQANLEFISMVNWRAWDLEKLFKSIEDLPISVALGLAEMSIEEQIYIYELLHPIHRLLDVYCGHPGHGKQRPLLEEWTPEQWSKAVVHLHPQLRTERFKKILTTGTRKLGTIALHKHFAIDKQSFNLDDSLAGCLYPLIEQPLTMTAMCDRWRQIHPVDPVTLEPIEPQQIFQTLRSALIRLEDAGYVLIELTD